MKYLIICLFLLGCITPDRTYNVSIDCQGEGHTINIDLDVIAPQDYKATAETTTDANVSIIP